MQTTTNTTVYSYSNFGSKYQLPEGMQYETGNSQSFKAGNYCRWLTTEIEIYRIKF